VQSPFPLFDVAQPAHVQQLFFGPNSQVEIYNTEYREINGTFIERINTKEMISQDTLNREDITITEIDDRTKVEVGGINEGNAEPRKGKNRKIFRMLRKMKGPGLLRLPSRAIDRNRVSHPAKLILDP
jgi:hypothetical protein